jgi:hypothetical protein
MFRPSEPFDRAISDLSPGDRFEVSRQQWMESRWDSWAYGPDVDGFIAALRAHLGATSQTDYWFEITLDRDVVVTRRVH